MEAAAAALQCVKEEKMVTAALPEHMTRLAHSVFAKVKYGTKIIAWAHLLLFLQTVLFYLSVW